jgi:tRNA(Arg) A34 adenosine deaminase TadA
MKEPCVICCGLIQMTGVVGVYHLVVPGIPLAR